jgi:hypothetical protein
MIAGTVWPLVPVQFLLPNDMATALDLNASSTIINGHGLQVSPDLLTQITNWQNQSTVQLIISTFSAFSQANANTAANISGFLSNLGTGVTRGQWLIDYYPSNVTPVCSGSVYYYGNITTVTTTPTYTKLISVMTNSASFSHTLLNQANLPLSYGLQGFANVYASAESYALSTFDIASSLSLLSNRTYSQSGIGFKGPMDLATNGVDANVRTIANVISSWGTMYDITNLRNFGDVYVFGQNLLNQKLGSYGNLSVNLTAAGLDVKNLSQIPHSTTTTSQVPGTTTTNSVIGAIEFPTLVNTTSTNSVPGSSPDVVKNIYSQVTGANLQSIITATDISTNTASITSLADYLDISKVVDPISFSVLQSLGITDFDTFGSYLQLKFGQGRFHSWADLSAFLQKIEIPNLYNSPSTANSLIVPASVVSTISSQIGTGTGPFNNILISDMLGSVSGIPHTPLMANLNTNYSGAVSASLISALNSLYNAIITLNAYDLAPSGPAPSPTIVQTAVNSVNAALNSLPQTSSLAHGTAAYNTLLSHLSNEVSLLSKAGATFNYGNPRTLNSFSQRIGQIASDKVKLQSYQFFSNLITKDSYGDTISASISEKINSQLLSSKSIPTFNDPGPSQVLVQAQAQNVPLSTYISQNK